MKRSLCVAAMFFAALLLFFGSCMVSEAETNQNTIPNDAEVYNGHYYRLYTDHEAGTNTWESAREFCENLGGHLAVISSSAEDKYLFGYIRRFGKQHAYFGYYFNQANGAWEWVSGEDSGTRYTNWKSGEPNYRTTHEYYAEYTTNGQWNDNDYKNDYSNYNHAFICEWDSAGEADREDTEAQQVSPSEKQAGDSMICLSTLEVDITGDGVPELLELIRDDDNTLSVKARLVIPTGNIELILTNEMTVDCLMRFGDALRESNKQLAAECYAAAAQVDISEKVSEGSADTVPLTEEPIMADDDLKTGAITIHSQGDRKRQRGTLITNDLIGKNLYIVDEVGGWWRWIADKDCTLEMRVDPTEMSCSVFQIRISRYTGDEYITGERFTVKREEGIQTFRFENIKAGDTLYWWDDDYSGRDWTLRIPFYMRMTVYEYLTTADVTFTEINNGDHQLNVQWSCEPEADYYVFAARYLDEENQLTNENVGSEKKYSISDPDYTRGLRFWVGAYNKAGTLIGQVSNDLQASATTHTIDEILSVSPENYFSALYISDQMKFIIKTDNGLDQIHVRAKYYHYQDYYAGNEPYQITSLNAVQEGDGVFSVVFTAKNEGVVVIEAGIDNVQEKKKSDPFIVMTENQEKTDVYIDQETVEVYTRALEQSEQTKAYDLPWEIPFRIEAACGDAVWLISYQLSDKSPRNHGFIAPVSVLSEPNPVVRRCYGFIATDITDDMVYHGQSYFEYFSETLSEGGKIPDTILAYWVDMLQETGMRVNWLNDFDRISARGNCTERKYINADNITLVTWLSEKIPGVTDYNDVTYLYIFSHGTNSEFDPGFTMDGNTIYKYSTLISHLKKIHGKVVLFFIPCWGGQLITTNDSLPQDKQLSPDKFTIITAADDTQEHYFNCITGSYFMDALLEKSEAVSDAVTKVYLEGQLDSVHNPIFKDLGLSNPKFFGNNLNEVFPEK